MKLEVVSVGLDFGEECFPKTRDQLRPKRPYDLPPAGALDLM